MDALKFLKQEHQAAKAAFAKIEAAPVDERGRLWNELKPELEVHEQIEEACVYGPVADEVGAKDPVLADWKERHQAEVEEVDEIFQSIEELDSREPEWLATVAEVRSSLEAHIQEEEGDIFRRIAKAWDPSRLEQAGAQLQQLKADKLRRAA
jgi:hypothetical protein